MAPDRGIGYRGAIPWHLPDDLKTFKRITTGHPVLMGRKTYESIGRPLPGRQNIVLTRDPAWTAEGVQVVHSAGELECLELMDPEIMVIGGAEIFSLMMPAMSRMWVSKVKGEYPVDTFLPPFENRLERAVLKEHFEDSPFPAPLLLPPTHRYYHLRRIRSAQRYKYVLRSALSPGTPAAPQATCPASPPAVQREGPH